jgi:ABC-type branched-subunit amino acid transport system substrate-binding protein
MNRAFGAAAFAAMMVGVVVPALAQKHYAPGITDTEIKIGQSAAYSGPAAVVGTMTRAHADYFKMIDEQGGVNGRKLTLISLDDGFNPARTVANIRTVVEDDHVAFIFGTTGDPTNLAILPYLKKRGVPLLFPISGSRNFYDPKHNPNVVGWYPTYFLDGRLNARYVLKHAPNAKIGILFENDAFGREHVAGLMDGLGDKAKSMVVAQTSYEPTDATVDSQVIQLQQSGADTFYLIALSKFDAQAIRKADEIGWKPLRLLDYTGQSIDGMLKLAGLQRSVGIISHAFLKDPIDPKLQNAPELKTFLAWEKKYDPEAVPSDANIVAAYAQAITLVDVLKKCGSDLTRENIVRQATTIHDLHLPMVYETLGNSPQDYELYHDMLTERFDGKEWVILPPSEQ